MLLLCGTGTNCNFLLCLNYLHVWCKIVTCFFERLLKPQLKLLYKVSFHLIFSYFKNNSKNVTYFSSKKWITRKCKQAPQYLVKINLYLVQTNSLSYFSIELFLFLLLSLDLVKKLLQQMLIWFWKMEKTCSKLIEMAYTIWLL